jgi:hypothetical protein
MIPRDLLVGAWFAMTNDERQSTPPTTMMNGAGVTNYDAGGRPSYGYTASTTQFDEELIRRGIVTRQQALMAKGMTAAQAQELLQVDSIEPEQSATTTTKKANADETEDCDGDDEDIDDDEDNDEFVQEYRRKRLAAMMAAASSSTEPLQIDRTEWTRHVNEASQHRWVVVCLTSSDTERTGRMEHAIRIIARATGGTRRSTPCTDPTTNSKTTDDDDGDAGTGGTPPSFVFIPAHGAIPNWPVSNLPSLFLYRHGTMQHELIRLRTDLKPRDVLSILQTAGVVVAGDIDLDDMEESDVLSEMK